MFILVHQIVHHGIFRDSHGGSGQLLRRRKAAVRRRYDEEPAFLGNGTEGHGDDADVGTGFFQQARDDHIGHHAIEFAGFHGFLLVCSRAKFDDLDVDAVFGKEFF